MVFLLAAAKTFLAIKMEKIISLGQDRKKKRNNKKKTKYRKYYFRNFIWSFIRANNFLFFVPGLFFLFFFFFFLSWLSKIIFPILMPTFILRFIVHTPNMGPMQIDLHYQKNTYYYIQKTNNSSWCRHKSMCFYYYGTYICKQSHI